MARSIRIEAERLRRVASHETIAVLASDMRRIAAEMDKYAARLEQSFVTATLGVSATEHPERRDAKQGDAA